MNLSLKYIKVLLEFLQESGQTFEVVSDVSIIATNHWNFSYKDLDGQTYLCSIVEDSLSLEPTSVVHRSEVYGLVVVVNQSLR